MDELKYFGGRTEDIIYDAEQDMEEDICKKLVAELMGKRLKIACAESLTGGLIAEKITSVPGASGVFECGICSYSNRIKHELLGVSRETLEKYTEYSAYTAAEMVQGLKQLSGADICVSATGIAGPGGGSDEKPVGLVYIGILKGDSLRVLKLTPAGTAPDRETVREIAACTALKYALLSLNKNQC